MTAAEVCQITGHVIPPSLAFRLSQPARPETAHAMALAAVYAVCMEPGIYTLADAMDRLVRITEIVGEHVA